MEEQKEKTKVNEKGYLEFADSKNLVHIWKAKKKYGKDKLEGMQVHHIDGDKQNNDYSNLLLLSKEDHYYLHQQKNKERFLIGLIIVFSVIYFMGSLIGSIFPQIKTEILVSIRLSVAIILIIAIELKYNFIAKTIRRPNERIIMKSNK